jgi:lipopolysaccharide transport system ATP-binding protein
MSDTLIKVEEVSKKFCRSLKRSLWYGMRDLGSEILGRRHGGNGELRKDEFWAVDDVSFELKRSECLGLIGRNGAGKTTVLKLLNGLVKPDKGRIEVRGRVGALIALGAGFNPILTGRENIYVNASVLGLSKREIDSRLDEIIDFAEIGESIDSPVQTYSSGMQVRLGFSVATTLEPDIILLDEVLAVGDAAFRNRCYQRLGERRKTSAAILVSHSMDQVGQFCDRVLVLSEGRNVFDGDTAEGIAAYERLSENDDEADIRTFENVRRPVTSLQIRLDTSKVLYGEHAQLKIDLNSEHTVPNTTLKIVFYDQQHRPCAEWNSQRIGLDVPLRAGANSLRIKLGPLLLKTGRYRLGIVLTDEYGLNMLIWSFKKHEVVIEGFTALGPSTALRSDIIRYPDVKEQVQQ